MSHFDIIRLEEELKLLEDETMKENFWNDSKDSTKILSKIKQLKSKCTEYNKIKNEIIDLMELTELANIESDTEVAKEIIAEYFGMNINSNEIQESNHAINYMENIQ